VARVLEQALREESEPAVRLEIANRVIGLISGFRNHEHLADRALLPGPKPLLVEISPPHALAARYLRPETPLTETSLFTGAPGDPPLARKLAAEIRLPEALEEKLLCPFHYFGVADPVPWMPTSSGPAASTSAANWSGSIPAPTPWRSDAIHAALVKFELDLTRVKGIGFCVNVGHAAYMARMFSKKEIPSAVLTGDTGDADRGRLIEELRAGKLTFLFTVDVLNEGLDVPEINTVLFLRPTESLTIFLQQLGRGLRRAPDKDALTVLDFVGQAHRKYRIDRKLKALLPRHRYGIDKEVELSFTVRPELVEGLIIDNCMRLQGLPDDHRASLRLPAGAARAIRQPGHQRRPGTGDP